MTLNTEKIKAIRASAREKGLLAPGFDVDRAEPPTSQELINRAAHHHFVTVQTADGPRHAVRRYGHLFFADDTQEEEK